MQWPSRAYRARVVLLSPLQDVDVYVEDSGAKEFYKEILRRILPRRIRVHEVFEAGGRERVIELCAGHDFSRRAALFIIDGDFPWVRGEPPPSHCGLFRLDAYCIENLLIDKTSIVEHAFFSDGGKKSREAIERLLELDAWIDNVRALLEELFLVFAVANLLTPEIPTVSRGVGSVIVQVRSRQRLDKAKIDALCANLRGEVIQRTSQALFDEAMKAVRTTHLRRRSRRHDLISGKDFLLPLLRLFLAEKVKEQSSRETLKLRLAANCSRRRFGLLKKALIAATSAVA